MQTRIATDTATIVIFDPERLKHRLEDTCDWWSVPDEEVAEINEGNVLFLSTGTDGVYDVEVGTSEPVAGVNVVEAAIKNQSGRFFVGAGEYTSGEGLEPTANNRLTGRHHQKNLFAAGPVCDCAWGGHSPRNSPFQIGTAYRLRWSRYCAYENSVSARNFL